MLPLTPVIQFASAAKKMKNDPHVTEVSDEGALLKRYRNEIVDLKRRLNEASLPHEKLGRTSIDTLLPTFMLFLRMCEDYINIVN